MVDPPILLGGLLELPLAFAHNLQLMAVTAAPPNNRTMTCMLICNPAKEVLTFLDNFDMYT